MSEELSASTAGPSAPGSRKQHQSALDVGCSTAARQFLLLNSGAGSAAFNMALDQALLDAMPRLQRPVLRFYGWTEPAASFGYFQKYAEIETATRLRPLVRRPTGGGLVPHDADWTYSLAFPAAHEWYALTALDSYRHVHAWIRAAFQRLNVKVELASDRNPAKPGQCFVGYERFDVLWRGRKIAGAAQHRTRNGLLIQGSVQPPQPRLSRMAWEEAMRASASASGEEWIEFTPDAPLRRHAAELASKKYSQPDYNRKR